MILVPVVGCCNRQRGVLVNWIVIPGLKFSLGGRDVVIAHIPGVTIRDGPIRVDCVACSCEVACILTGVPHPLNRVIRKELNARLSHLQWLGITMGLNQVVHSQGIREVSVVFSDSYRCLSNPRRPLIGEVLPSQSPRLTIRERRVLRLKVHSDAVHNVSDFRATGNLVVPERLPPELGPGVLPREPAGVLGIPNNIPTEAVAYATAPARTPRGPPRTAVAASRAASAPASTGTSPGGLVGLWEGLSGLDIDHASPLVGCVSRCVGIAGPSRHLVQPQGPETRGVDIPKLCRVDTVSLCSLVNLLDSPSDIVLSGLPCPVSLRLLPGIPTSRYLLVPFPGLAGNPLRTLLTVLGLTLLSTLRRCHTCSSSSASVAGSSLGYSSAC